MKKSTLLAGTAVIGAIATLAAVNLKLKSEYTKGNIKNPYTITKLASFKYIKVVFDSTSRYGEEFKINISKDADYSIGTYYSERAKLVSKVSNDTLIITNDPFDKDHYSLFDAVIITAPQLVALDVTKGSYVVKQDDTESLSISANNESKVDLKFKKINTLMVNASGKAFINVSTKDTINQANIQLNDLSSFSANNIVIRQKKLQLGDSTTLHLKGRSVKDFGVQ
ncbi:MAG: DUF2807 domain-containing protein [Bacteroidota bacterium]